MNFPEELDNIDLSQFSCLKQYDNCLDEKYSDIDYSLDEKSVEDCLEEFQDCITFQMKVSRYLVDDRLFDKHIYIMNKGNEIVFKNDNIFLKIQNDKDTIRKYAQTIKTDRN